MNKTNRHPDSASWLTNSSTKCPSFTQDESYSDEYHSDTLFYHYHFGFAAGEETGQPVNEGLIRCIRGAEEKDYNDVLVIDFFLNDISTTSARTWVSG